MSRPVRVLFLTTAIIAASGLAAACGSQRLSVPKTDAQTYHGAVLFSQRCSGCHTLSYAATHGSAANIRTAQPNNGPNFNVRCERPVTRALYAIENGGFSGAIMPQNIVVGQDAIDVAKFVATYAGRQAPKIPGAPVCTSEQIGAIPAPVNAAATTTSPATSPATASGAKASGHKTTAKKSAQTKSKSKSKASHP